MRPICMAILTMTLLVPWEALAETSYRIRGIGTAFEAIVDDYLTDAGLNPARVGDLDGRMLYGTRLPGRSADIPYPSSTAYYFEPHYPIEEWVTSFSYSPLTFTYADHDVAGFGLWMTGEMYVNEYERGDQSTDLYARTSNLEVYDLEDASTAGNTHILVDVAAARGSFGARITGWYDLYNPQSGHLRSVTSSPLNAPNELAVDIDARIEQSESEQSGADLSLGFHRAGALVREAVIGGGPVRHRFNVFRQETMLDDEDADKNGQDPGGGPVTVTFREAMSRTDRAYGGFNVFARLHLNHGERFRSAHAGAWTKLTGDGSAMFAGDDTQAGQTNRSTISAFDYAYDGTRERFEWTSTFGYRQEILDEVLIAAGVRGHYHRATFDEQAEGMATVMNTGLQNPIMGTLTTPYVQSHDRSEETLALNLPVGLEWRAHRFVAIRLGLSLNAVRTETTADLKQEALDQRVLPSAGMFDHNADTNTGVTYSNGLEFNVDDRLIVDLVAGTSGYVNLTEYYLISARLMF